MSMPEAVANKLITVLEKLFADFNENLGDASLHCRNNDASTALYEVQSAINMMDIPYIVREALEVPHPVHNMRLNQKKV